MFFFLSLCVLLINVSIIIYYPNCTNLASTTLSLQIHSIIDDVHVFKVVSLLAHPSGVPGRYIEFQEIPTSFTLYMSENVFFCGLERPTLNLII